MGWRFIVAPQWQGSGSSRAMRLIDGAEAIRGDLPSSRTTEIETPPEAGDSLGTEVGRLSAIVAVRDRLAAELAAVPAEDAPLLIGGDCGVEAAALDWAVTNSPDTCVLWFDAHADLNTPGSSPSSAFSGMVLRTALGDGEGVLVPEAPLRTDRVVLVGVRATDDAEAEYIAATPIASLGVDAATPETLIAAVEATGATSVYVHVDLDVLDPADIAGVASAEPFGLPLDSLLGLISGVRTRFPVTGGAIVGFAPESPVAAVEDLPSILRILSAITSQR
ncbi:arginase family protein [Amnibacterium flavum]|uniref:Arginase n=1 Tax=Amnibacterium flavum TaxID=2173173 RepID=A0A2V1HN24_9MICO|nr:arginase family protein [Amnibacterium flavum]PVZ93938.1 arginase [Amnibacterium flavum]